MIKLDGYSRDFEEEYWEGVAKVLDKSVQEQILESSRAFLPEKFFVKGSTDLKELVLAPFAKLKETEDYIRTVSGSIMDKECFQAKSRKLKHPWLEFSQAFVKMADARRDKDSMRVRIVKQAGLTVCPYCNRDYINCRAGHVSGAQLDHFSVNQSIRCLPYLCTIWFRYARTATG